MPSAPTSPRKNSPAKAAETAGPVLSIDGPEANSAAAEAFIAEKRIGDRIKRLRLKRSMGLVELGRQTGLSASFLSQLETGRVVPTLRNLARIAMVFNKDLSFFFEPEPNSLFRVHRKCDRVRMPQTGVDAPTYFFESIGYMVPDRHLDPYYAEFLPQQKIQETRPHVHPGFEFLYLLSGELEVRHGDTTQVLQQEDGVYFDASMSHSYRCTSRTTAAAIIVTMHQQGMTQPTYSLRPMGAPVGRVPARPTRPSSVPQIPSQMRSQMKAVVNGIPVEKA